MRVSRALDAITMHIQNEERNRSLCKHPRLSDRASLSAPALHQWTSKSPSLAGADQLAFKQNPYSVFAFLASGSSSPSSAFSPSSGTSSSSPSKAHSSSPSKAMSPPSSSNTCFHSAAVIGLGLSSSGSLSLLASKYSAALINASTVPLAPSFSTICSTSSKSSPTPRMSTGIIISSSPPM